MNKRIKLLLQAALDEQVEGKGKDTGEITATQCAGIRIVLQQKYR